MLALIFAALAAGFAHAADTGALAAERWQANHKISFYCDVGRPIVASCEEALSIRPSSACSFKGPLNSKIPLKNLQPPFLNPLLTRTQLKAELLARGVAIDGDAGGLLRFHLPSGETFAAQEVNARGLEDTLMRLTAYPSEWGSSFLSIAGSGLPAFQKLAKVMAGSSMFWRNPHVKEEEQVRPRFERPRQHLPLQLVSKCDMGAIEGVRTPLMFVGDMHTVPDAQFLLRVLNARPFSWIALEITRDRAVDYAAFLNASGSEEETLLSKIVNRIPTDTAIVFKDVLRFAKARGLKVVFMDYSEPYFNFPFTDTSFHGAVIGTRNLLWVSQFPASWSGTGLVFGGLAHFTDTPGADIQNFVAERFPGVQMVFVNPLEKCEAGQ